MVSLPVTTPRPVAPPSWWHGPGSGSDGPALSPSRQKGPQMGICGQRWRGSRTLPWLRAAAPERAPRKLKVASPHCRRGSLPSLLPGGHSTDPMPLLRQLPAPLPPGPHLTQTQGTG